MIALNLRLLGGFEAGLASGAAVDLPVKKAQALLAFLGLPPGRAHQRETLAALLWGQQSDARARDGLRHGIAALREALPPSAAAALRIGRRTLVLDEATVAVDVAAFERRAAEGTPQALEEAAALYRGDLLLGFGVDEPLFEEWLRAERERLREVALEVLARLLAHQSTSAGADRAIQTALRLLALDPLQEAAHRTLMRLYARQGRRSAALKQYQLCLVALERELGVEPEPDTRALYLALLREQSAKAHGGGAGRGPGLARSRADPPAHESPLVGRETELALLSRLLGEAMRGRGHAVALLGEAGIGKSRLVSAVVGDAVERGGWVLVGHGHESDSILPFGPWVEALRHAEALDDPGVLDAVGARARSELSRLLPELSVPGLPASTSSDLRLFEGVARLIEAATARRPVVLVLEDLHWADEMTLRLVAFVGRRAQKWPALLLVTAREEDLVDSSGARRAIQQLLSETGGTRLALPPLTRPDTDRLVRSLGPVALDGGSGGDLEAQIWALSEGNPFVAIEIARALHQGAVLPGGVPLALPDRVRDLIEARLERLSPAARELAAVAAVIGRAFDFPLVQRAAGTEETAAAEAVEELVRRRILRGSGDQLDFGHERLRRHMTARLLPSQRAVYHRRVGESLEALHGGRPTPPYLALAAHFRDGEVWNKAARFFRLAAGEAMARSASREAVTCIDQAMAALARLPADADVVRLAIDLRIDQQGGYLLLGELSRMLGSLREAERLAEALRDDGRLARVWVHMAACFWWMARLEDAVNYNQRARATASALGDEALGVQARSRLALALTYLGEYRPAIEVLGRSLDALTGERERERFGMPVLPAVCDRGYLALCLAAQGDFDGAARRARQALDIAVAADHPYSEALGLLAMGRWSLARGDFHAAIPWLERCLASCRLNAFYVLPTVATCLGEAWVRTGRRAEAIPLLEEAVERGPAMGFLANLPKSLSALGEAYLLSGRRDDAGRAVQRALDASRAGQQRGFAAEALRTMGAIQASGGPSEAADAAASYRDALALAQELGMRPLAALCRLGLARLGRGEPDQATPEANLAVARRMLEEMGMTYWLQPVDGA